MAVDEYLCRETDTLVLPKKTFYPLRITVHHWQLRHYISSSQHDLIYYADEQDIYCLNPVTRKRVYLVTLPFSARCTASGYGWICVGGGDHGPPDHRPSHEYFASIKVDESLPSLAAEVDSLLPLELGGARHRGPIGGTRTPRVNVERIGNEIINSISIHKLPAEGSKGDEEAVAVLTNNDRTARIYSLTKGQELCVLDLPFCTNHATISPDGKLLVAVGDEPLAFFFERITGTSRPDPCPRSLDAGVTATPPDWVCFSVVQLYVPRTSEGYSASSAGYFTTAWSPSGTMCALGSECGYVTVFDVETLKTSEYGEDAIIDVFRSSRPSTDSGPGAVRTMMFAPQPWDLLIWSEDQSRVCVADLRAGLRTKQILTLNPEEEGLDKADISDYDADLERVERELRELRELRDLGELTQRNLNQEADFIRQYRRALDTEGNSAALNFATDYIEAAADRRRRQSLLRNAHIVQSDDDPHGMTPEERQIVESLSPRTRIEASERSVSAATPRSINYTPAYATSTSTSNNAATSDFPALGRSSNRESERRTLNLPSLASIRDPSEPARYSTLSTASNPSGATPSRSPATLDYIRSTYLAAADRDSETAYTTLSSEARERARRQAQRELVRQRALNPQLQAAYSLSANRVPAITDLPSITTARAIGDDALYLRDRRLAGNRVNSGRHDPGAGVRTAGLAMSRDGRRLWCGSEEGIFEFNVDLARRMACPSVELR